MCDEQWQLAVVAWGYRSHPLHFLTPQGRCWQWLLPDPLHLEQERQSELWGQAEPLALKADSVPVSANTDRTQNSGSAAKIPYSMEALSRR